MFQALISGMAAFVGINAVGAANRKFYDNMDSSETIKFNTSCIWVLITSVIGVFLFLLLFNEWLQTLLNITSSWIFIALVVCIFNFLIHLRLGQWQVRGEAKKYGVLQVSNSILNLFFTLVLVVIVSLGGSGRVYSYVFSAGAMAIISLILLHKGRLISYKKPEIKHVKEIVKFGFPLIPHVFGIFLLTILDRVIINDRLGLQSAGVYMLAAQISMALLIIFDAINKAYLPWLFDKLSNGNMRDKQQIVKATYIYFIILLFIGLLGFLLGPHFVVLIAGENYKSAGDIIGWLILGQVFGGMYLMVTNYIFYSKETSMLSLVTISTGVFNVFLVYSLVDLYGMVGAGYSFCFSMFMRFIFTWFVAAKKVDMPWFSTSLHKTIKR